MRSNTLFLLFALTLLLSSTAFYHGSKIIPKQHMRLAMIFNIFNNKKTAEQTTSQANSAKAVTKSPPIASARTSNAISSQVSRFGEYIPAGVSKEQYEAAKRADAEKKLENKKRFVKGKVTESLTEWIQKNEEKGLTGVELNRKGHRMLKMKYDDWYTDESPV